MIVTLDPQEAMRAVMIGAGRELRRRRDQSPHRHGAKADPYKDWGQHIESVGAEMAFAKWLGVYYNPTLGPDGAHDVGGVQVRSSTFGGAHLILHDNDTGPAVLVTGQMPEYRIRGWAIAEEVKVPGNLREPQPGRPCYWIDAGSLQLLDTLRHQLRRQEAA